MELSNRRGALEHAEPLAHEPLDRESGERQRKQRPRIPQFEVGFRRDLARSKAWIGADILHQRPRIIDCVELASGAGSKFAENVIAHSRLCEFDVELAYVEASIVATDKRAAPVGFTDDPFEALERQDELQRKYTGGTVLHLYMSEPLSSADACRRLVQRALSKFRLPYVTVTPTFSICPKHGYLAGKHEFCPKCDAEAIARKQGAMACLPSHQLQTPQQEVS